MCHFGWYRLTALALASGAAILLLAPLTQPACAQEPARATRPLELTGAPPPSALSQPAPTPLDKPLPINLPTALQLADARPLDIALASERIRIAAAQLDRARVL